MSAINPAARRILSSRSFRQSFGLDAYSTGAPGMRKFAVLCMRKWIGKRETPMAYTLEEFCAESRAILQREALASALPQIAARLGQLLSNPAFVAATFSDDMPPGKRVLHHDAETDFYVLAHVQG